MPFYKSRAYVTFLILNENRKYSTHTYTGYGETSEDIIRDARERAENDFPDAISIEYKNYQLIPDKPQRR